MYGPSDYSAIMDGVRAFFSVVDGFIYMLITVIYQIFFNVASSTLFSGEVIRALFSRVQLILGVIMLFKLAISLLGGIVNPDSVGDKKTGFGNAVTRIVIALVMLVLVVPLNIPSDSLESDSYAKQLNNNGILFGTMYEFQNRVLSENTIGKIILNKNVSADGSTDLYKDYGDNLASTILKTFITVNLMNKEDEDAITGTDDYLTYAACVDDSDSVDAIEDYISTNDYRQILENTHGEKNGAYCKSEDRFTFNYAFLVSTIVGVLFLIIMIGFTLDIAIRAFKLVILRLVAPIPIIAYIDSKGESSFKAWTKNVITTYVDVFIRVAVVFFIVFIIDQFTHYGIDLPESSTFIKAFTMLFILLGLFYFAKEAPKFLLESIGMQYKGGYFSGFSKVLGGLGVGAGILSSGIAGFRASQERAVYKAETDNAGRAKRRNFVKALGAGATNALGGFGRSVSGVANAKDHYFSNATGKVKAHNNEILADAKYGVGTYDRIKNSFTSTMFGDNDLDRLKREEAILKDQITDQKEKLAAAQGVQKRFKDLKDYALGQAEKSGKGAIGRVEIKDGAYAGQTVDMELDAWNRAVKAAETTGSNAVKVKFSDGSYHNININDAYRYQSKMNDTATASYIQQAFNKGDKGDPGVKQRIDNLSLNDGGGFDNSDFISLLEDKGLKAKGVSLDINDILGTADTSKLYDVIDSGEKAQFSVINKIQNTDDNNIGKLEAELAEKQKDIRKANHAVRNDGKRS